ncbi:MAG: hypothetical protein ACREN5_02275 [Gemmatimonadales bacterium]
MPQSLEELVTFDVIPLVRTALKEVIELTGAVQILTQHVEELTAELGEGEITELRRLVSAALRTTGIVQKGETL